MVMVGHSMIGSPCNSWLKLKGGVVGGLTWGQTWYKGSKVLKFFTTNEQTYWVTCHLLSFSLQLKIDNHYWCNIIKAKTMIWAQMRIFLWVIDTIDYFKSGPISLLSGDQNSSVECIQSDWSNQAEIEIIN